MKYVWSASNNAFFERNLFDRFISAGWSLDDAIDVSDDIFNEYTNHPEGKVRIVKAGQPAWTNIAPPSHEELVQTAEFERQRLLNNADAVMLDWRTELMLGEISDANRAKLSAWMAYKNEVKSADVTTDPEHVNWPVSPEV